MRQINLIPRELAVARRSRQLIGVVIAAALGVLLLLVIVFLAQQARLSSAKHKLEARQATNAALQRKINQLSQFSTSQTELTARLKLLSALTGNEVTWSQVLTEISLVMPADDWLTSFTATATAPGQTATSEAGTINVSGCTLIPPDGTHLNVAQFLIQITKPLEFGDPFLTLTSKGTSSCPVQFTAQLSLTNQATRTARGGERKI